MYKNYEVLEVTKDNKDDYINQIAKLEENVYQIMKKEGNEGLFFSTGIDGISEYIDSSTDMVLVAVKDNKNVIAATYITSDQIPFSYNDITKYFKADDEYQNYIKSQYEINNVNKKTGAIKYESTLKNIYRAKILAFKEARQKILDDRRIECYNEEQENNEILKLIKRSEKSFDERNEIRAELNAYMYKYMKILGLENDYEKFYWVDSNFVKSIKKNNNLLSRIFNRKQKNDEDNEIKEDDSNIKTYDEILKFQKYKIYEKPKFDKLKYYNANTKNTIEIDTYITSPVDREKGLARILVLEGIKKSLENKINNTGNQDIYLVSTLHRENLSSKYVSEFFGLKDYLYVNRRKGRDREVHICGMKRNEIQQYIEHMEKKIAVIYDYNPNKIIISNEEKNDILNEQLKYETEELERLKSLGNKEYIKYIKMKNSKIKQLKEQLKAINKTGNELKGNGKKSFREMIKFDTNSSVINKAKRKSTIEKKENAEKDISDN